MSVFRRRFIGDKAFYKTVLGIMIPVIIQNSVTNFVNLLDNIMVGQLGTEQMSGVAIANQLHFIFALCIFGGLAGPGIFGAQFFGAKDHEGLRNTFRIKIWFSVIITAIALVVFTATVDRSTSDICHSGLNSNVKSSGSGFPSSERCIMSSIRRIGSRKRRSCNELTRS